MLIKFFKFTIVVILLSIICGAVGAGYVLYTFGRNLPDYRSLEDYESKVTSRVHAADGRLIAEFSEERRSFVPFQSIPPIIVNAFVSAEDKNFYSHFGVDVFGIIRAVITNIKNIGSGRRLIGASTITQQVARYFWLTNEVSYERKIKEMILALRIGHALEKEQILELYLNEIFLGKGSYGIASAALNYFDKSLVELTLAEVAFLAGLPKAPNNYQPTKNYQEAVNRRNYVLMRMFENGYIDQQTYERTQSLPLEVRPRTASQEVDARYFVEEVRRKILDRFGKETTYGGGLSVRSTLDSRLQSIANTALRNGLENYDRRHGYRGPLATLDLGTKWEEKLKKLSPPKGTPAEWLMAIVVGLDASQVTIRLSLGGAGIIPLKQMKWARETLRDGYVGKKVVKPSDVLSLGDVILVEPLDGQDNYYTLRQVPDVSGAIVAMDPHTGRVLAMVGGYSFSRSQFNRVTQALRQPGSAFKTFVYLAALENGYAPNSKILDAPFIIDQGPGLGKWRPDNYSKKFYGMSTLRTGLEKSRNLMTIRLAQNLGLELLAEYAKKMGVADNLQLLLPVSIGAHETTLMQMVTAYAMLVNGGKHVTSTLIDRVQDRYGKNIYQHDQRKCEECEGLQIWRGQKPLVIEDVREQVITSAAAYQVVSLLEGVVQNGTGKVIRSLNRPLAGKTGTSNDQFDAWFIGFSPDLVMGVFVGFDTPRNLGKLDAGSRAAAPIFKEFMGKALAGKPAIPFRIPETVRLVRINRKTGQLAAANDKDVVLEAFLPGTEPVNVDNSSENKPSLPYDADPKNATETRGLY